MPDASWALVEDDGRPVDTVASRLVSCAFASPTDPAGRVLLERWGRFVGDLPERAAFAATADNVCAIDDTLDLASDLREGIEPLDDEATRARLCWHLARTLVVAGAATDTNRTVDQEARRLGGVVGWQLGDAAVARALAHEATMHARCDARDRADLAAAYTRESAWTMTGALRAGAIDEPAQRVALASAWEEIARLRRDLERAETEAVGHVAARTLATDLGEVLERDEWIRARLRKAKSAKPARLLIAARKKALGRA